MDRKFEFDELKQKMKNNSTEKLDSLEKRFNRRIVQNRIRVTVLTSLMTILVFVCTFVGLVNVSPKFVYACSKLPVISDLANAVCISESIKSMVYNEYGVSLGETQTADGIKVTMDKYIICNNNIYLLVSVEAEKDMDLACLTKIKLLNGEVITEGLTNLTIQNNKGYFKVSLENDSFNFYRVNDKENYIDKNKLKLDISFEFMKIQDKEYYNSKGFYNIVNDGFENSTNMNFSLIVDMTKNIVDNEVIYFSKTVEIDNQILTFANANLNPAYISIDLFESESNTKSLDNVVFYIKNSEGKEFKTRPNETYLHQINGREKKQTYYLETPYFDENEQLYIYITRATFLSKDYQKPYINLENIENSSLPIGVELISAKRVDDKVKLSLRIKNHSLKLYRCFDESNNEYEVKTISRDGNNYSFYTYELEIEKFPEDKLYFDLFNDTFIEYDEPLRINIR